MKIMLKIALTLFLLSSTLFAEPIKVPNDVYFAKCPNTRAHPGLKPFISHVDFRNMCDHIIDQSTEYFDPEAVKLGDTIYLNVWYLEWYLKNIHDQIQHPYILVTCDVGGWLPHPDLQRLLYDSKLAAWFCRNMVLSHHPKLFQIPMGQDIVLFGHDPKLVDDLLAPQGPFAKERLLYLNFFAREHADRKKIEKMFADKPFCFSRNDPAGDWNYTERPLFYKDLGISQFTLSPLGLETDCVRTWEAFLFDCIPIVEHSFLDPLYEGLPIVIVHEWEEITQEFLEKKYAELKDVKSDKIYFDYWYKLIKATQQKVRAHDLAFADLEATLFYPEDLSTLRSILSEKGAKERPLIYKGFASTLRPFQVASAFPFLSKVYLYDSWLNQQMFDSLCDYSFAGNNKMQRLDSEAAFINTFKNDKPCAVFLDLSYYRTSLFLSFQTSTIGDGNFRHSLKRDLKHLYKQLRGESLLVGNMSHDTYVSEVLETFSKETGVPVEKRGDFWFVTKEKGDPTPHFTAIFKQLKPKAFLELGSHDFTSYFLDSCNKVITVEFVTSGNSANPIKEHLARFNEYSNWVPIVYFSNYNEDKSWAPYKYLGSEHVHNACSYQCATIQNYAMISDFYITELSAFFGNIIKCHKPEVAFIDPRGMYLRGDMVQILFNKVPVIMAADIGCRPKDIMIDVYGYRRIVTPENYEEISLPEQGVCVWVKKDEKYKNFAETLKRICE